MKCQQCAEREANVHLTKILNGNKQEFYLCDTCANEKNDLNYNSDFNFDIGNFLSSFLENSPEYKKPETHAVPNVCPSCGSTYASLTGIGNLGCCTCYQTFADRLRTPLKQIHGSYEHNGKIPSRMRGKISAEKEIEKLTAELNVSIAKQEFERAAEIRDRLKEIRG